MNRTLTLILAAGLVSAGSFLGGKALSERGRRPADPSARSLPGRKTPPGGTPQPLLRCSLDCLSARLHLTPEQRRQCAASDRGFEQRRARLMKEFLQRRTKLMEVLREPNPSRKKIDAALNAMSRTQTALQRAVIDHLLRLKTFLTPAQQDKLFDSLGKHMCSGMGMQMRAGETGSRTCQPDNSGGRGSH